MTKANLPAFINDVSLNVNVGIDEVVSVFVTKYEDALFAKKDELSGKIKSVKASVANLDKMLIGSVDRQKYNVSVPQLGFTFDVKDVKVNWEDTYYGKKNTITVELAMYDKSDKDNHSVYTKNIKLPMLATDIADHKSMVEELEQLNAELLEVMTNIKSVSRKERQIRGRISEMKLEKAGHSDLLSNPELLKLTQM